MSSASTSSHCANRTRSLWTVLTGSILFQFWLGSTYSSVQTRRMESQCGWGCDAWWIERRHPSPSESCHRWIRKWLICSLLYTFEEFIERKEAPPFRWNAVIPRDKINPKRLVQLILRENQPSSCLFVHFHCWNVNVIAINITTRNFS